MRILERIILVLISFFGILYTFRFGNLISRDHTAGILGIPFLIILLTLCFILFFSKSNLTRIRIILYSYLVMIISYTLSIIIIQSNTKDAFEYLYSFEVGEYTLAEKILGWHCLIGCISYFIILFLSKVNSSKPKK